MSKLYWILTYWVNNFPISDQYVQPSELRNKLAYVKRKGFTYKVYEYKFNHPEYKRLHETNIPF